MQPAPPIIVGHSAGGFIVQKYLETHQTAAAVLLASVAPNRCLSAAAARPAGQSGEVHAQPLADLSLREAAIALVCAQIGLRLGQVAHQATGLGIGFEAGTGLLEGHQRLGRQQVLGQCLDGQLQGGHTAGVYEPLP